MTIPRKVNPKIRFQPNWKRPLAVVNENDRLLGVVNRHKFFEIPEEYRKTVKLDSVMIKDPFFAYMTVSDLVRLYDNEVEKIVKIRKGNSSYWSHSADIDDDTTSINHS